MPMEKTTQTSRKEKETIGLDLGGQRDTRFVYSTVTEALYRFSVNVRIGTGC